VRVADVFAGGADRRAKLRDLLTEIDHPVDHRPTEV
jgi:hypothetical protein